MAGRTLRCLIFLGMMLLGFAETGRAAVPAGFSDTKVFDLASPTALAFTPDGRMLVTTQPGSLRVWNGTLLPTPALTLSICAGSERGLLGVAVDPNFATNRRIYLFYTASSCVNRVSRFTFSSTPGQENLIDPASEMILVNNMPSPAGNHNAGDLQIGKDGYLYISIGDGGCDYANNSGCGGSNDAARDQHVLTGKILRVTLDGGIPPSNPFQATGMPCRADGRTTAGNKCQETFAWGLRNPFRIAMDPNAAGTRFFINDVGQNAWEEIDNGQAGADYGWNCREGAHTNNTSGPCNPAPPGMVNPIFEYSHGTGCGSITGGAFVPNGLWPGFDGAYLFSDYVCGKIFKLTQSGATWSAIDFATSLGPSSAVHLRFGPWGNSQALYYTTYAGDGEVRRISYNVGGNNPPVAAASGSPTSGPAPLTVTFDATGSSDPDPGDTLTYFWDFGDGTPEVSTTSLTIQHTYTATGQFTARLRVRDNDFAFSAPDTVQVQPGNAAPVPSIANPGAAETFSVGEQIVLQGSATDPQDGTLPASSLSWTVLLHHDAHTHPFLGPVTGNNIPFTAPAPEDVAAAENSFLEVRLTATDSGGLSTTVIRNFQPNKVTLTLDTEPPGLGLRLNNAPVTAPFSFTSWAGWVLTVQAPNQTSGGDLYLFAAWEDSSFPVTPRQLPTPAAPATFTAVFQASETGAVADYHTLTPCRIVDTRGPSGLVGGPALAAGQTRTFPITGFCGVPSTAKAVAINVTVVAPSTSGHLRIWPADDLGTGTTALTFNSGAVRANNTVAFLGAAGDVDVLAALPAGTVHVVIDVMGYFE
jgi:glucose/arabinose dehydrogenase